MRLQVNVGDNVVKRIDMLAKEIGVTRSALCSMIIYHSLPDPEDAKECEDFKDFINYKVESRLMYK